MFTPKLIIMQVTSYILKAQLKSLRHKENIASVMLLALFIAAYFYAGHKTALVLNVSNGSIPGDIYYYMLNAALLAPLCSAFIPSFTAKHAMLPAYLPLPEKTFFRVDLLTSMLKKSALSAIAFAAGLLLFYHSGNAVFIVVIVLNAVNAILLTEVMINIISWRKFTWSIAIIAALAILLLIPKLIGPGETIFLMPELLAVVILFVACRYSFALSDKKLVKTKKTIRIKTGPLFKEVLLNKTTATLLGLLYGAKIIVLFILPTHQAVHKGLLENPAQLIFLFPVFLFAYIFNNSFGFFKGVFFSNWLYNNATKSYVYLFAQLFAPFLLIDAVITGLFLVLQHKVSLANIILYCIMAAYNIIIAIISSVAAAKKTETLSMSSFRKNTSTIASIILLLPVIAVMYLHTTYGYVIWPLTFLIVSAITFIILYKKYAENWQQLVINKLK